MSEKDLQEIDHELQGLVGDMVRVAVVPDGWSLNHFGPAVVITGELESKKAEVLHAYRVLLDKNTYSYFTPKQVVLINTLSSITNITLSIPVEDQ